MAEDKIETTDTSTTETATETSATETTAASTAATADTGTNENPPAGAYWPEDWRQHLAGEDADLLKRLARFQSPENVLKSWRSLETRMAEARFPLKADANPEELAAWRKANGVPEKPEDYLAKLPDGLVVGDEDKPALTTFVEKMHARNADPALVGEAVAWWNEQRETLATERAEEDRRFQAETEEALRAEWGNEYRVNVNTIKAFLDSAGIGELIRGARGPDGQALGNNPTILKWLAGLAAETNPALTVVPAGGDQVKTIETEISNIEKVMRETPEKYYGDQKMQDRFNRLLNARMKLAG